MCGGGGVLVDLNGDGGGGDRTGRGAGDSVPGIGGGVGGDGGLGLLQRVGINDMK